ncbi:MAG: hypothetical protein CMP15_06915 [Rickettsiales bacterium]|nr:hypothetical protein [Pelagibacterales bacterium]MBT35973.1 hypothetical protein [Rickettsiales bacterium]|tara:strand:+ start:736 stop:1221 length:486 start_codon:yes stop_codon:yes gene_type:complete
MFNYKSLLVSLTLCIFFISPGIAAEKAVGYFGWFGVGKTYTLGTSLFWAGEFSGSFQSADKGLFHKASVRCPASQRVNLSTGMASANGVCIIKDVDGDEAYLDWNLPNWKLGEAGRGTYSYTGGTGKYENLSGDGGYFYGHTITLWDDGTAGGYSVWNREP